MKALMLGLLFIISSCSSLNNLSGERRDQLEFRAFTAKDQTALKRERIVVDPDIAACYKGEISKTIKKVKSLISSKESNRWPYWSKLAACHFLEGEISLAIYYNQLIVREFTRSKREQAFPYNNMGVIYFEKDMPEQAETYFLKAQEISPNSVSVKYNLSSLYMHYGEFNKALSILKSLKPGLYKDSELFYSYALGLTYKGHFKTLSREMKRFRGRKEDFDKLKLLQAVQKFASGKRISAYETAKSLKGRYLSSVEEKARDKIVDIVEEEIEAKKKAKEKKNEK